jgi:hypothetical protein
MRRYETRSTMMTSNRPLEDWGKLIGDVPSATAILDRFLHHAEIVQMTGKSYRLRNQGQTSPRSSAGFRSRRHSALHVNELPIAPREARRIEGLKRAAATIYLRFKIPLLTSRLDPCLNLIHILHEFGVAVRP